MVTREDNSAGDMVTRIRSQVLPLGTELQHAYALAMKKAEKGALTAEETEAFLRQARREIERLRAAQALGEISPSSFATARQMLRDGLGALINTAQPGASMERHIQQFVIDELPMAQLEHPRYRLTQDWFHFHIPQWQELLGHLRGRCALRALEVGCYEGRATTWLLEELLGEPGSSIICIDPFLAHPRQEAYFDFNIAATGQSARVTKLRGYSQQLLPALQPGAFDLVYIDGSHAAPDVIQDAVLAWPLVKPEGILIFDDYEHESLPGSLGISVKQAVDAFLLMYRYRYKLLHKGWQVALKRLV